MRVPSNKDAVTTEHCTFNYDLHLCPRGQKVQALTEGGVAIYTVITSVLSARNMGIIAWFPVPVRDREKEKSLGYTY